MHVGWGRYQSTRQFLDRVAKEPGVTVWRERYVYRTPDEKDSRAIIEQGTDMRVGLLMYQGARYDRYDRAILIASDGDYAPAVEMLCALGKEVIWAHTSEHAEMKALTRAGARPYEMTPDFLATCRYVGTTPVGGLKGSQRHV